MLALLDTNVWWDLLRTGSSEAHAATHVVSAAADGADLECAVALCSLQELLDVGRRRALDRKFVAEYVRWLTRTFTVIGHAAQDVEPLLEFARRFPDVDAADALIWSAGVASGVDFLVTRDKAFGRVVGERWIDPMDANDLRRLLAA